MADSEREFRGGAEVLEEVCLDTVGREDCGNDFGEFARVVAHVVTYDNADLGKVAECFEKVVGESLGGCADCIYVHTVGTCSHDAAQTACTEFKVFVE